MKVILASIGKANDKMYSESISDYSSRLRHYMDLEWYIVYTEDKLLSYIKEDDMVILLDEKGVEADSIAFSKLLEQVNNSSKKRAIFVIGGAHGASDKLKSRADKTISLSRMVFPHMLVRLILVEQLYRASTILKGEKYHHQ